MWIRIVAGLIFGVLGEMVDAIAVLAIVLLNAVIGFDQGHSAEESIAVLIRASGEGVARSRPFLRRKL